MTQAYYTKNILPTYCDRIKDAETTMHKQFRLQEDNDSSHGTRSENSVARQYKDSRDITRHNHPANSPDLNPTEGC